MTSTYNDDDHVLLCILLHGNSTPIYFPTFRKVATELMHSWWNMRTHIYAGGEEAERASKHQELGTYAGNTPADANGKSHVLFAFRWSAVIAMFVRDREEVDDEADALVGKATKEVLPIQEG